MGKSGALRRSTARGVDPEHLRRWSSRSRCSTRSTPFALQASPVDGNGAVGGWAKGPVLAEAILEWAPFGQTGRHEAPVQKASGPCVADVDLALVGVPDAEWAGPLFVGGYPHVADVQPGSFELVVQVLASGFLSPKSISFATWERCPLFGTPGPSRAPMFDIAPASSFTSSVGRSPPPLPLATKKQRKDEPSSAVRSRVHAMPS